MAGKQHLALSSFHNGLNTKTDARDIAPDELALQYQLNEWQSRVQRDIYNEKQSLLTQYYMAQTVNDIDEMRAIREKMNRFNNRELTMRMGIGISSDTIYKSVEQRNRKANEQVGGRVLPDRERIAIMEALGYPPDALMFLQ